MTLPVDLPTNLVIADTAHTDGHNTTNGRVNDVAEAVNELPLPLSAAGAGTVQFAQLTGDTPQALRWLGLGDSVASLKMRWMYPPLTRALGGGEPGFAINTGSSGTGWALPGVSYLADTGTVTDATTDYDAWPTGLVQRFSTSATRTYGRSGVAATWDTVKVYYVKGPSSPDGGTFKLQVDGVDETGFTNVSTANATVTLGVATVTKGSVAQRAFKVVNLTGAHRIAGVAFFNSTQGGIVYSSVAKAGLLMTNAVSTATGVANLGVYLADFAPDVITLECKEDSADFAASLAVLLPALRTAAPAATIVGIGSTPIETGDADQVIQNGQLRVACAAHGCTYWDGYGPVVNYTTLEALGWEGDGTHVDDQASAFLGSLLMRDLGLLDHPGMTSGRAVDTEGARLRGTLDFGEPRADGHAVANLQIAPDVAFGLDTTMLVRRELQIAASTGTVDGWSWLIRPDNGAPQQIPYGVRVGETGPFLRGEGDQLNIMSARGGGSARDLGVRWLLFGSNYLWVDTTGKVRVKTSEPTTDTDGTVVGTQT